MFYYIFRLGVPGTRFQSSIKMIKATINFGGIGVGDIIDDITGDKIVVARKIDLMLY